MVVASLKSLRQRGQVMHAWIVSLFTFTIRFAIFRRQTNYLFSNELTHVSNHCMPNTKQAPRFLRPFPRLHLRYQTPKRGFHNHNKTSTGKMRRITYEDLIKNLTGNACKERKDQEQSRKLLRKGVRLREMGFGFSVIFPNSRRGFWVIWSESRGSLRQKRAWTRSFFGFFSFSFLHLFMF